jgi:hypothetical protein
VRQKKAYLLKSEFSLTNPEKKSFRPQLSAPSTGSCSPHDDTEVAINVDPLLSAEVAKAPAVTGGRPGFKRSEIYSNTRDRHG